MPSQPLAPFSNPLHLYGVNKDRDLDVTFVTRARIPRPPYVPIISPSRVYIQQKIAKDSTSIDIERHSITLRTMTRRNCSGNTWFRRAGIMILLQLRVPMVVASA